LRPEDAGAGVEAPVESFEVSATVVDEATVLEKTPHVLVRVELRGVCGQPCRRETARNLLSAGVFHRERLKGPFAARRSFKRGQFSRTQAAIARSSLSEARLSGFCSVQPSDRSRRATYFGGYRTPNILRMTCAARRPAQRSVPRPCSLPLAKRLHDSLALRPGQLGPPARMRPGSQASHAITL